MFYVGIDIMPLQTPEEMENTPIPKLGSITWTKCSERMPPDSTGVLIILKGYPEKELMFMSGRYVNKLVPRWREANYKCKWTPCTPEKLKELNK